MSAIGRVLVSGSAGLVGRRVVDGLVGTGADVTGIDIVDATTPFGAHHLRRDLARDDLADLFREPCNLVVHAAAIPDLGRGHAEAEVLANNTAATARLMFAALEAGVRRIVHVSSQSVLGLSRGPGLTRPDKIPIDETHPCRPRDGYALSKKLGEDLGAILAERFQAAITSVRLPVVWDPAGRAAHVSKRLGDPEQAARSNWAYVDARDAAQGIILAGARSDPGHRIYHIAARKAFCQRPLAELVAEAYGPIPCDVDLADGASLFTARRAMAELGFSPRHVWTETEIHDEDGR